MIPFLVNVLQYPVPSGRRCFQLGRAIRKAVESYDEPLERADLGHRRHEPPAAGPARRLINQEWDNRFLDRLIDAPARRSRRCRTSNTCARPAARASSW